MSIFQSFKLAVDSIVTNKMRSFLTMLGMIIGVASVIALVSLMQAMTDFITDSFAEQGTNNITVNVMNTPTRNVDVDDMYELMEEHKDLFEGLTPQLSLSQPIIKNGMESVNTTSVTGVSEDYHKLAKLKLSSGNFFEYSDIISRSNVCVVGSYIVDKLYDTDDVVGKQIKINNEIYTIIGVLEEKAGSLERSGDDIIYISYSNAMKQLKSKDVPAFVFVTNGSQFADMAKNVIEDYLYDVFKDEDFYYVFSMKELLDMVKTQTDMMSTLLVGIAGISLLVAGIGIMNIMLVSVSERTREIGIRKSLGAKRKDIMRQFVIEATVTSSLGGIIGIIIGGVATTLLGNVIGFDAVPTLSAIGVSFGVAAGIGILFGYMPASRAAKLNPIDALRSD